MTGHIVVGVDGSKAAQAAGAWAADDARRRDLALRIVHVCEQQPAEHATGYCTNTLAFARDQARELADGVPVTTELLAGNVVDRLLAESETADSVVLGSRGIGEFTGLLVGSVSLAVAGHAAGTVVIVRDPGGARHDRVVVGYDDSEHAEAALEYAVEHARAHGARVDVLHAWRTLRSPKRRCRGIRSVSWPVPRRQPTWWSWARAGGAASPPPSWARSAMAFSIT
jgi:nucleotide-binding universal stress UspA family protein